MIRTRNEEGLSVTSNSETPNLTRATGFGTSSPYILPIELKKRWGIKPRKANAGSDIHSAQTTPSYKRKAQPLTESSAKRQLMDDRPKEDGLDQFRLAWPDGKWWPDGYSLQGEHRPFQILQHMVGMTMASIDMGWRPKDLWLEHDDIKQCGTLVQVIRQRLREIRQSDTDGDLDWEQNRPVLLIDEDFAISGDRVHKDWQIWKANPDGFSKCFLTPKNTIPSLNDNDEGVDHHMRLEEGVGAPGIGHDIELDEDPFPTLMVRKDWHVEPSRSKSGSPVPSGPALKKPRGLKTSRHPQVTDHPGEEILDSIEDCGPSSPDDADSTFSSVCPKSRSQDLEDTREGPAWISDDDELDYETAEEPETVEKQEPDSITTDLESQLMTMDMIRGNEAASAAADRERSRAEWNREIVEDITDILHSGKILHSDHLGSIVRHFFHSKLDWYIFKPCVVVGETRLNLKEESRAWMSAQNVLFLFHRPGQPWALGHLDTQTKHLEYYNPHGIWKLGFRVLKHWLEYRDTGLGDVTWNRKELPRQKGVVECGMLALLFAKALWEDRPVPGSETLDADAVREELVHWLRGLIPGLSPVRESIEQCPGSPTLEATGTETDLSSMESYISESSGDEPDTQHVLMEDSLPAKDATLSRCSVSVSISGSQASSKIVKPNLLPPSSAELVAALQQNMRDMGRAMLKHRNSERESIQMAGNVIKKHVICLALKHIRINASTKTVAAARSEMWAASQQERIDNRSLRLAKSRMESVLKCRVAGDEISATTLRAKITTLALRALRQKKRLRDITTKWQNQKIVLFVQEGIFRRSRKDLVWVYERRQALYAKRGRFIEERTFLEDACRDAARIFGKGEFGEEEIDAIGIGR